MYVFASFWAFVVFSCFEEPTKEAARLLPLGQLLPNPATCTRPLVGSSPRCLLRTMLLKVPLSTSSTQKSREPSGFLG